MTITANYKHGIASDDDLIIEGGDITILPPVKDGLYTGSTYSGGSTWAAFITSAVVTYVGGSPPPPGP